MVDLNKLNTTNNTLSKRMLNTTSTANVTITKTFNLNFPLFNDIDIIVDYLKMKNTYNNKFYCNMCLDPKTQLSKLLDNVMTVKNNLTNFNNVTESRHEVIVKFSEIINEINLIKMELLNLNVKVLLNEKLQCKDYNIYSEKFNNIMKTANQLIEVIQDTIRKQSLNINFIIIG